MLGTLRSVFILVAVGSLFAGGCGSRDVVTKGTPSVDASDAEESTLKKTDAVAVDSEVSPEKTPQETSSADADSAESKNQDSNADEDGAELGELKLRFEYAGTPPKPAKLNLPAGQFCGKFQHVNETLLVHPENKGIRNVVVYVYTGRGGVNLPATDREGQTVTLANQNCRFEPHIVITQKGDTLRVTNPDQVGHNANLSFFNNKPENPTIPPGEEALFPLTEMEPAPIPVDCNIHPWMKAYVLVLDHPYVGVSDESGELTIKGLPVGEKLVFRAFHEAARIADVTVAGKQTEWKRSRFEVEIKAGKNDLGTVVLPAESFR